MAGNLCIKKNRKREFKKIKNPNDLNELRKKLMTPFFEILYFMKLKGTLNNLSTYARLKRQDFSYLFGIFDFLVDLKLLSKRKEGRTNIYVISKKGERFVDYMLNWKDEND